jgi:hypothetical protein
MRDYDYVFEMGTWDNPSGPVTHEQVEEALRTLADVDMERGDTEIGHTRLDPSKAEL